ncbi:hypothetical protein GCM10009416_16070 [Craurococcus roseus]|uniref:Uncharacterized protein n=1 Tax=Craurococcus roseus TaxID=77585 RepID=A0ABN1EZ80_9PROT
MTPPGSTAGSRFDATSMMNAEEPTRSVDCGCMNTALSPCVPSKSHPGPGATGAAVAGRVGRDAAGPPVPAGGVAQPPNNPSSEARPRRVVLERVMALF